MADIRNEPAAINWKGWVILSCVVALTAIDLTLRAIADTSLLMFVFTVFGELLTLLEDGLS